MQCTVSKLAPVPLVFQPPHSAHPTAFTVHMCSVEELYIGLYEPLTSNSFTILHV